MTPQNIRDKLMLISQMNRQDTHNAIANSLLKFYDEHLFLLQKDLAEFCHTSISMITNFAKKLGFSGYRELLFHLKLEREYYDAQLAKTKSEPSNNLFSYYRNQCLDMLNTFTINDSELKKILSLIQKAQRIFLFSSYEQLNNTESFSNVLMLKNYNVFFSKYRKSYDYFTKRIQPDDLAIFIIAGLDNQTLVQYYKLLKNRNIPVVIISSYSQEGKFFQPDSKIVIANSPEQEEFETARNIYMNFIFNVILLNL